MSQELHFADPTDFKAQQAKAVPLPPVPAEAEAAAVAAAAPGSSAEPPVHFDLIDTLEASKTAGDMPSELVQRQRFQPFVVCAGHACIDVILRGCDEMPTREGYAAVDRVALAPGGAVSNTAMQLGALGVPVHAMTIVGDDDFGSLLTNVNTPPPTAISLFLFHPCLAIDLNLAIDINHRAFCCRSGKRVACALIAT